MPKGNDMLRIKKSQTADSRYVGKPEEVTKETLIQSSLQHKGDVTQGLYFFAMKLLSRSESHDEDKISNINGFHADFITNFKNTSWWDNHRKITRHHLLKEDGIPDDVNLIDVLEMITDCVMAGMGRSGSVYPLNIDPEVLMRAFNNTTDMLKSQVVVEDGSWSE